MHVGTEYEDLILSLDFEVAEKKVRHVIFGIRYTVICERVELTANSRNSELQSCCH